MISTPANLAAAIWAYATRTLASGTPAAPTVVDDRIAKAVWEYATRTLSATGQFARPASDVADGNWLNESSSNANLYESINEETASDTDYIRSGASPSNDTCTVGLSSIGVPAAGTVTLRVRARYV